MLNIKLSFEERYMSADTDTVAGWFVLNAGFKVSAVCPACSSPRISYYKVRQTGLKGISSASKGLTPACVDCGKGLPAQILKGPRPRPVKRPKRKAAAS